MADHLHRFYILLLIWMPEVGVSSYSDFKWINATNILHALTTEDCYSVREEAKYDEAIPTQLCVVQLSDEGSWRWCPECFEKTTAPLLEKANFSFASETHLTGVEVLFYKRNSMQFFKPVITYKGEKMQNRGTLGQDILYAHIGRNVTRNAMFIGNIFSAFETNYHASFRIYGSSSGHEEAYNFQPIGFYCSYNARSDDALACREQDRIVVSFKDSNINVTRTLTARCQQEKNCGLHHEDAIQRKSASAKRTVPQKTSNMAIGNTEKRTKPAISNMPRTCEVEVIADVQMYSTFFMDDTTGHIQRQILQYFYHVNEVFRRQDFDGDGLPDNVQIHMTHLQYFKDEDEFAKHQDIGKIVDKANKLEDYLEWVRNYTTRSREPCAVILFLARDFPNDFHVLATEQGNPDDPKETGICANKDRTTDKNQMRSNGGVVTVVKDKERLPDTFIEMSLLHLFGHLFGAKHDDHPDNEKRNCTSTDPTNGQHLMASIPVDGSLKNHRTFSRCSLQDIGEMIEKHGRCLRDESGTTCGNGYREPWEPCDCGSRDVECSVVSPCCTNFSTDSTKVTFDSHCIKTTLYGKQPMPDHEQQCKGNIADVCRKCMKKCDYPGPDQTCGIADGLHCDGRGNCTGQALPPTTTTSTSNPTAEPTSKPASPTSPAKTVPPGAKNDSAPEGQKKGVVSTPHTDGADRGRVHVLGVLVNIFVLIFIFVSF